MRTVGAKLIAHAWAHGLPRPKGHSGSSVRYNDGDDTIYSYGSHFPMAKHYGGKVLLTTQSYSNTTGGHLSAVRSAISHMDVIECYFIPRDKNDTDTHTKNIGRWIAQMKDMAVYLGKARLKQPWLDKIADLRLHARKYIDLLKVKVKSKEHKLIFDTDLSGYAEAAKKEQASLLRKKKLLDKKAQELHEQWLPAWREFKEEEFFIMVSNSRHILYDVHRKMNNGNAVWLRADETNVYTSKGLELPHDVAKRYYKKYLAVVKMGGCDNNCDYKMLDFTVKAMSADVLHVGCHLIPRSEIDYIANKLNW